MTETLPQSDWLLIIGRWGCIALRALLWLVALVVILAVPYMIFADPAELAELQLEIAGAGVSTDAKLVVALVGILALTIIVLIERFLEQLQRIIESVGAGEPFAPINADRLTRMGWLLLASQAVALLGMTVSAIHALSEDADFSGDLSVEGLFIVVLLFILARVFRHGAAMREDLEGTV